MTTETLGAICLVLLIFQLPATLILLSRLLGGAKRPTPLEPRTTTPEQLGSVSVLVPTLNEVERIGPCLFGLTRQSYEVREILIVDSNSQDGTREKVLQAQKIDPRFRLLSDDPLPSGWIGRPWALHYGFLHSNHHSEWILGVDADTEPQAGLIASLLATAEGQGYDLLSVAPRFVLKYPGEWWLQPALLMSLLYRVQSPGIFSPLPERVMANGQCFLCRRSVLQQLQGYTKAANSFCDDVTLAREIALAGFKVGFFDGTKVIKVRMYDGALQTWQEWGRSLALQDATTKSALWGDVWFLLCVQGLPLCLCLFLFTCVLLGYSCLTLSLALWLNLFLVAIRFALLWAIANSYERPQKQSLASWLFWVSPLADPLAWLRILLSASNRPTRWRGRIYPSEVVNGS